MKIQFKEQPFQIDAVRAVVDCFQGQPLKTNRFTLQRSKDLIRRVRELKSNATQPLLGEKFQEDIGYRNSSLRITKGQLLDNINQVQQRHYLIENQKVDSVPGINIGPNFTIEMETGTGKTYTYIRTMFELHKSYGWNKYIIIVPSIAIREGVYKSFQMTEEHFQEIYGHKINTFIYNSARPQDIESFASDNRISVMIINTQAFAARSAAARRIYQELDQFGSRKPIEILSQTNPILIIDEPQSVGRVGTQSLKSMQEFRPLFTLRYSATHAEVYNKIYRLDALDAFNKQLVKKIQVKGINLRGSTGTSGYLYLEHISVNNSEPPRAVVEFEIRSGSGVKRVRRKLEQGADLYQLSGELPIYKNSTITEIDGFQNKIVINGEEIYAGDVLNNKDDEHIFRRIQIRETIQSHLAKEKMMFKLGIKVLSLFFIDSVEKYRIYDDEGEAQPGEYAKIFEDEYYKAINDHLDLFNREYTDYVYKTDADKVHKLYAPTDYEEYLRRDSAERVHNGYFSIDKRGRAVDSSVKRGSEYSDDVSAYELIMKDKERLLSFDEPTRFIFSHSALKEGWDNPNVFQICTLKNMDSGSETRRRQEVGRGMRLCVDKRGVRQDFELLGDRVHEVNKLTVVASESYENFARGLQSEIANSLGDRPLKADRNYFINKLVVNEQGSTYRLNSKDAERVVMILYSEKIIDIDYRITPEGKAIIEKEKLPLPDNLQAYSDSLRELMRAVYTGEVPMPVNERKGLVSKINDNFSKKEFQELWKKISLKTMYEVKFDTKKLIEQSKNRIDRDLNITGRSYRIVTGEQREHSTKEQLQEGKAIVVTKAQQESVNAEVYSGSSYDLVGEIEALTNLKRSTIVTILQKINPNKFMMFRKNPEEFIAKTSKLINETKASLIINNIVYHKTNERFDAKTVFTNEQQVLRGDEILKKHIYDFLNTDSKVEQQFAKNLEEAVEVVVYAKLPRNFYISTPVANFSPDWAIVLDKERVKHIYFVAETKGSDEVIQLREIEQLKIYCATEHFKAISGTEVKFDVIPTYSKLLDVAELK